MLSKGYHGRQQNDLTEVIWGVCYKVPGDCWPGGWKNGSSVHQCLSLSLSVAFHTSQLCWCEGYSTRVRELMIFQEWRAHSKPHRHHLPLFLPSSQVFHLRSLPSVRLLFSERLLGWDFLDLLLQTVLICPCFEKTFSFLSFCFLNCQFGGSLCFFFFFKI